MLQRASNDLKVFYELTERALAARPAEILVEIERDTSAGLRHRHRRSRHRLAQPRAHPFICPDVVKLDMTLVHDPLTDTGSAIAAAVRAYAADTGALILAEGIETAEHEARADLLGAELGQGWGYGRPAPLPVSRAPSLQCGRSPGHRRAADRDCDARDDRTGRDAA